MKDRLKLTESNDFPYKNSKGPTKRKRIQRKALLTKETTFRLRIASLNFISVLGAAHDMSKFHKKTLCIIKPI